ncbi:MAG: dihydropyrimidinase [Pseudomonadota bacterium]
MSHDLVIAGGTLATPVGRFAADIGIRAGRIATLGTGLEGAQRIEAAGKLVLPGGVETHCHLAQEGGAGIMGADGYRTGSISAAMGGTTTIVPFAAKTRERSVGETLDLYAARAAGESVLDYANHLILTDAEPQTLADLPAAFARGITALKVFTTYGIKIDDRAFLELLVVAKAHGVLTMVHAENDAMIGWTTERLVAGGYTAPRYHAPSHPVLAEVEAIGRAIALARLVDAPLLVVHVSTPEGARLIREARAEGAKVWGETCPQYLVMTRDDLDRPGMEGAKWVCSPPPRDAAAVEGIWQNLSNGALSVVSSDHAPYRADATGKFMHGADAPFNRIANGVPGLAARLPILFSEGVMKGRITMEQFVALTATTHARLYGLAHRKGSLAIGADADIAIWDPEAERRLTHADTGDAMDYTPYEGMAIRGWPVTVLSRGEVVVEQGALRAEPGRGEALARGTPDLAEQPGTLAPELDPARNFGAEIAP